MLTHAAPPQPAWEFAEDVRAGLTKPQKELSSKYLYDDVGSALFEVISVLPEYGLTRADERCSAEMRMRWSERLPIPLTVAELGSGSGKKTRWLLKALARRQPTAYCPIEISPTALAMCKRELADIDAISILGFEREYLDGPGGGRCPPRARATSSGSVPGQHDRKLRSAGGSEFPTQIRRTALPRAIRYCSEQTC